MGAYISHDKHSKNNQNKDKASEDQRNKQPIVGIINIIIREIVSGGESSNRRKQYASQYPLVSSIDPYSMEDITFGSRDLEGVSFPHDDALVISAIIVNFKVKRILVDIGSAANFLSRKVFIQIVIVDLNFHRQ